VTQLHFPTFACPHCHTLIGASSLSISAGLLVDCSLAVLLPYLLGVRGLPMFPAVAVTFFILAAIHFRLVIPHFPPTLRTYSTSTPHISPLIPSSLGLDADEKQETAEAKSQIPIDDGSLIRNSSAPWATWFSESPFKCPSCGATMRNDRRKANRPWTCPACSQEFQFSPQYRKVVALGSLLLTVVLLFILELRGLRLLLATLVLWLPVFSISIFLAERIIPPTLQPFRPRVSGPTVRRPKP
jgi:ribosomal protein L37AE/L43A